MTDINITNQSVTVDIEDRKYQLNLIGSYVKLDFDDYQKIEDRVTSLSASSTDEEYPSAKCVYDADETIKASIPTKVSELVNDEGFAKTSELPTKTSQLTNDSGFITSSAIPTVNNATITFTQGGVSKGSITLNQATDETVELDAGGGGSEAVWGSITGTLADQTDLNTALAGKQSVIDSSHKLSADLVGDTSTTNKFVTASDISNWNAKQDALTAGTNITISSGTISATDTTYSAFTGADGTDAGTSGLVPAPLATDNVKYLKGNGSFAQVAYSEVSGTPSLATVATTGAYSDLTGTPDLSGYQTTANLVTSVDSSSTDSQYPSAKLFYDTCGDIETLINAL